MVDILLVSLARPAFGLSLAEEDVDNEEGEGDFDDEVDEEVVNDDCLFMLEVRLVGDLKST